MGIKIKSLTKKYGKYNALNQFSLEVKDGIFGLLGNNGAGKSTLMKILATLLDYDEGEVEVFGYDLKKEPEAIRSLLGYLPQDFDFFPAISLFDAMEYLAELKGIAGGKKRRLEIEWCLEQVELVEHSRKKIKELSGGMKQRFGIAQALLGDPKLIIVDEPTVGLDPNQRLAFRNLINRISKGRIILLSTHIVPDITSTCDQVAIVRKGTCLYAGYIDHLLKEVDGKVWSLNMQIDELEEFAKRVHILSVVRKQGALQVTYLDDQGKTNGVHPMKVSPDLENAFIYLNDYLKGEGKRWS